MTETRPAPPAEAQAIPYASPADPAGLAGWLTTSDHKRVGRLWIATSLVFLVVGDVVGSLLGVERIRSGLDLFSTSHFGQVYSLHAEVSVLLFLVPLLLGVATFIVPLQLGAQEIAFPRGSSTAYWLYLVSGSVLIGAYLANGGLGGTSHEAVDLWILAMLGVLLATCLALVSLLTTIIAMRAPGMTLLRTPAFSWSVLVGGSLTLLTAPVLGARLLDMYVTHHFGGDVGSYKNQVGWFWTVPQIYLLAVPAAGVALEIVPVLARRRLRQHGAGLVVLALFGVIGIGAWAQVPRTFTEVLYVGIGLVAVVPPLALLGLVGDTLRAGRPMLKAPLLFAVGTVLMLLLGGVAGALLVIDPLKLHNTVWEAGQLHLVLLGGGTLGGLGALWWWAPKLWGAKLPEGVGVVVFLATFVGTLLLAAPDLVNGLKNDLPLRATRFDGSGGVTALSGLSAAGGIMVTLGAIVAGVAVVSILRRRGEGAEADPWGGHTLEWATTSPPPAANFSAPVPAVTSATPLLTDEATA